MLLFSSEDYSNKDMLKPRYSVHLCANMKHAHMSLPIPENVVVFPPPNQRGGVQILLGGWWRPWIDVKLCLFLAEGSKDPSCSGLSFNLS